MTVITPLSAGENFPAGASDATKNGRELILALGNKHKNKKTKKATLPGGVTLNDFVAYMPTHSFIYKPTREMWPAASVNARINPISLSNGNTISASAWLDKNCAVEQMTWAPGKPMLIKNRLVSNGGWMVHQGVTCFNLYRPPIDCVGDASKAKHWLDHVEKVYPAEADHIIKYFASKVQHPEIKINHALLLGGSQGIGKDTICEPLKYAVGPWNFHEVTPKQVYGRFNAFLKSVILRINEIRDLGDGNRFDLYEHMKTITTSPPDVLRVDEKHIREYQVLNVCGVVITTNYKTNGIYLPADDRRHYVAWSDRTKDDFTKEYWDQIWRWYDNGGIGHVVAYLRALDISDFDPKAQPPKTAAFWAIVDANRSPEDDELADAIDRLGKATGTDTNGEPIIIRPEVVTIDQIAARADDDTRAWLRDRKNRRIIPHRLEKCGYVPIRNPDAKSDGQWRINGKRQTIYARSDLSTYEQLAAVNRLLIGQGG